MIDVVVLAVGLVVSVALTLWTQRWEQRAMRDLYLAQLAMRREEMFAEHDRRWAEMDAEDERLAAQMKEGQ